MKMALHLNNNYHTISCEWKVLSIIASSKTVSLKSFQLPDASHLQRIQMEKAPYCCLG